MTDGEPLNATEWEIWHSLKILSEMALTAVSGAIEAATGLSGADFGVLSRIEDVGDGVLAQLELQRSLGWDKSRLSHQITRMEGRGLLRRIRSTPRGVNIEITHDGRARIAAARPAHAAAIRKHILAHMRPDEALMLLELTHRMRASARVRP